MATIVNKIHLLYIWEAIYNRVKNGNQIVFLEYYRTHLYKFGYNWTLIRKIFPYE